MPEKSPPSNFGALLRDLVAWLEAVRVEGVVIGGLAACILGRPSLTRDVDLLVTLEPERWPELLARGDRFGFLPRVPDPLGFAERNRVLLLRHEPTLVDLDVSLFLGGTRVELSDLDPRLEGNIAIPRFRPGMTRSKLIANAVTVEGRPLNVGERVRVTTGGGEIKWSR